MYLFKRVILTSLTRHNIQKKSLKARIKNYYDYNPNVLFIKNLLFAKKTIVLFVSIKTVLFFFLHNLCIDNNVSYIKVNLDLIVDLLFCLAYLVEMKQESDVNLYPPWLFKYRSYDLWYKQVTRNLSI
jgi:hypothetical protein